MSSFTPKPGLAGSQILFASGVPSAGVGANGDYAIDQTAKVLYGPKAAGTWPAGTSFGATGSTGPAGSVAAVGSHKYWRLTHMQSGDGTGAQAAAAIGFRATAGGTAQTVTSTSSSPIFGVAYDSTKAQDNDATTYWNSSVGGTGVYYEAYFATAVAVREIAIMARNDAYASASSQYFKVWYSDDGLKYTIAAEMLTPTTYTASMVQTFGLSA